MDQKEWNVAQKFEVNALSFSNCVPARISNLYLFIEEIIYKEFSQNFSRKIGSKGPVSSSLWKPLSNFSHVYFDFKFDPFAARFLLLPDYAEVASAKVRCYHQQSNATAMLDIYFDTISA